MFRMRLAQCKEKIRAARGQFGDELSAPEQVLVGIVRRLVLQARFCRLSQKIGERKRELAEAQAASDRPEPPPPDQAHKYMDVEGVWMLKTATLVRMRHYAKEWFPPEAASYQWVNPWGERSEALMWRAGYRSYREVSVHGDVLHELIKEAAGSTASRQLPGSVRYKFFRDPKFLTRFTREEMQEMEELYAQLVNQRAAMLRASDDIHVVDATAMPSGHLNFMALTIYLLFLFVSSAWSRMWRFATWTTDYSKGSTQEGSVRSKLVTSLHRFTGDHGLNLAIGIGLLGALVSGLNLSVMLMLLALCGTVLLDYSTIRWGWSIVIPCSLAGSTILYYATCASVLLIRWGFLHLRAIGATLITVNLMHRTLSALYAGELGWQRKTSASPETPAVLTYSASEDSSLVGWCVRISTRWRSQAPERSTELQLTSGP